MTEFDFLLETDRVRDWVAAVAQRPTRVLALANQKGGVGKTTTAINLGASFAELGISVLLVDLDPQGNAGTGTGLTRGERYPSSFDILLREIAVEKAVRPTALEHLRVVPASLDLVGAEMELADDAQRLFRLRTALKAWIAEHQAHGYVLLDCPPSLSLLTRNALAAADGVLVPLQCEFFALEGLSQLLQTIAHIQEGDNTDLALQGVVLTMFDHRNNLSGQVEADVRHHLQAQVLQTMIPRNVRVSEAPSHGQPALLYDRQCAGALAYRSLAREILKMDADTMREAAA